METGILCAGKDEFLASQPFSVLERLSKLAKVQDRNRPKVLDCTYYLLMTMFMKYDNPNYDIGFDLILEKVVREMFLAASKRPVIPHMESVDAYVDIAVLISISRLGARRKTPLLSMAPCRLRTATTSASLWA